MHTVCTRNPHCKAMSSFVVLAVFIAIICCLIYRYYVTQKKELFVIKKDKKLERPKDIDNYYDVVIVGAGPAGSTAAYYLADKGYRVALLERKTFPRDKICGDAWCSPALDILEEMGILQELEEKNLCRSVQYGGLVSPFGYSCINKDTVYGSTKTIRTYAIKRLICDEFVAKKAKEVGAHLIEDMDVSDAVLDNDTKLWTVTTKREFQYLCRILICADGSTSYLGKKLGTIYLTITFSTYLHVYQQNKYMYIYQALLMANRWRFVPDIMLKEEHS